MTEQSPTLVATARARQRARAARQRSKRRQAALVHGFALALFVGILGLLGSRVAQGQDPALGSGFKVAQVAPRKVIVRKIILTRNVQVIRRDLAPAATPGAPAPATSAAAPSTPYTPVQSYAAPAQSAPAPRAAAPAAAAPAPAQQAAAPAPAPAPVQTSTS